MERLTCQKKIILDYLKSVQSHPSAEIIFKEAKKKLPQISLGTVYRNLNTLKQKGRFRKFQPKPPAGTGISQNTPILFAKNGSVLRYPRPSGRFRLKFPE